MVKYNGAAVSVKTSLESPPLVQRKVTQQVAEALSLSHILDPDSQAQRFMYQGRPIPNLEILIKAGDLVPMALTYAAEAMGYHPDLDLIISTLGPLAAHPNDVVVEGAMIGITVPTYTLEQKEKVISLWNTNLNKSIKDYQSYILEPDDLYTVV